jgi:hypothetical protein
MKRKLEPTAKTGNKKICLADATTHKQETTYLFLNFIIQTGGMATTSELGMCYQQTFGICFSKGGLKMGLKKFLLENNNFFKCLKDNQWALSAQCDVNTIILTGITPAIEKKLFLLRKKAQEQDEKNRKYIDGFVYSIIDEIVENDYKNKCCECSTIFDDDIFITCMSCNNKFDKNCLAPQVCDDCENRACKLCMASEDPPINQCNTCKKWICESGMTHGSSKICPQCNYVICRDCEKDCWSCTMERDYYGGCANCVSKCRSCYNTVCSWCLENVVETYCECCGLLLCDECEDENDFFDCEGEGCDNRICQRCVTHHVFCQACLTETKFSKRHDFFSNFMKKQLMSINRPNYSDVSFIWEQK